MGIVLPNQSSSFASRRAASPSDLHKSPGAYAYAYASDFSNVSTLVNLPWTGL